MERPDVLVVGAGQAGLSLSHELTRAKVEHLVLERGRIGQGWRNRWDSFCLVTPNWAIRLPDGDYDGADPDGFMPRDEIVAFLQRYASSFDAPVREGVEVRRVGRSNGRFEVETSVGPMQPRRVVLASGAYQSSHRPTGAASLPANLLQIDSGAYRNPGELPGGAVLIIGSGQSGCQLAEELHKAGRHVVLACGRAPWFPRRFGGHDGVWWVLQSGFLDQTVESLEDPRARLAANGQATGHEGGHDLNLRTLQEMGVTLAGHFLAADASAFHFAPDLLETARWGDEQYHEFADVIRQGAREMGLADPGLSDPPPFVAEQPERISHDGFSTVIFAGGYRPAYRSWLPWPDAFDEFGFPIHTDGESTVVPGLHFIGVHFLRKRKSSLLVGVGEDAQVVAARIVAAIH